MTACPACSYDPSAQVLARWEFTIPLDLPSLNERIHNGARGWKYRDKRDVWVKAFTVLGITERITAAKTKRRVTIVRLYTGRQREMDKANIDTKSCCDAMKITCAIRDDSPQWLELHVKQERGKERGTRVIVEELS